MLLEDSISVIEEIKDKIKDKYHQYNVDYYIVKEYHYFVREKCDIVTDKYCIDTTNRIVYLR